MTDTSTLTAAPSSAAAAQLPVIPGFHPDPTICRVGEDYYLANSSFEYFPGVPIFHSRDLTTWTQIGNALDRRSQFRLTDPGPSKGIYAPTLRHHDDKFWLITTNISDIPGGQVLVTAADAAGPWSEPVFVPEAIGIDPDLSWDDDGTCYLSWKVLDLAGGIEGDVRQAPIDVHSGRFLEPDYPLWQGSGMMAAEGPHLYHVGDFWYLLLAEGGTERGHSVTVARGSSPRGPFEPCPWNPILTHRSTGNPVQNVGHADLVRTVDGEWAAVFLGTRPGGSTPQFHTLGRETFVAGIDWVDGWPVFNTGRFATRPAATAFTDDFSAAHLDHRWVSPDGEPSALTARNSTGGLTLTPRGDTPVMCTRVRDLTWTAHATFVDDGFFQVRIDDRHWYGLRIEGDTVAAYARVGDIRHEFGSRARLDGSTVLRIEARPAGARPLPMGHGGPDDIVLSVLEHGEPVELGRLDGRYLSTEVAGGFTGRMLGVGATRVAALLASVDYAPGAPRVSAGL
jgi:beta-xylosidase